MAKNHSPSSPGITDEGGASKPMVEQRRRGPDSLAPQLPSGVVVRRATRKDARKFHAICSALDRWIDEWTDASLVYVAVRGEEVVAGAREWITSDGRSTIVDVWVKEDERGARLGHAVMRHMIDAVSAEEVYIDCVPSLEAYYAELGFKKIDRSLTPDILEPDELPGSIVMILSKSGSDV